MTNLTVNPSFRTLIIADIFENIGISLFNIILLTYAHTFSNADITVSLVSIGSVLPGILGILTGQLADYTFNKSFWLTFTKFIQAGLYFTLAQLINEKQLQFLLIIILINIFSDIIGMYSNSLRMPIIQAKINLDIQEEAIGINQGIATIMQTIGQTIGITLLALTHNYQLAGYINSFTFLIAGITLIKGYRYLTIKPIIHKKYPFQKLLFQIKQAFESNSNSNAWALLGSIFFMNAVGSSMDAIINLYLIDAENKLSTSFSVNVLIINTVIIIGNVLGSILHSGWFKKLTFKSIMFTSVIALGMLYINLLSWRNFYIIIVTVTIAGFCMGQANPKLTSNLLKTAGKEIIGSITGLMNTISIISMPLGTVGIVFLYNLISPKFAYIISIFLLFLSAICLFVPKKDKFNA